MYTKEAMFNKKRKPIFFKKPDFIVINNIYDDLAKLVETYGITKVILHLGQLAQDKISREFAGKIWRIVSEKTTVDPNLQQTTTNSEDD